MREEGGKEGMREMIVGDGGGMSKEKGEKEVCGGDGSMRERRKLMEV